MLAGSLLGLLRTDMLRSDLAGEGKGGGLGTGIPQVTQEGKWFPSLTTDSPERRAGSTEMREPRANEALFLRVSGRNTAVPSKTLRDTHDEKHIYISNRIESNRIPRRKGVTARVRG